MGGVSLLNHKAKPSMGMTQCRWIKFFCSVSMGSNNMSDFFRETSRFRLEMKRHQNGVGNGLDD